MSEKSSSYSHNVLINFKSDEHAEVEASLEDGCNITEADDDTPPTEKATKEEGDVEGMLTKIHLQRHCLNEECHGCHLPAWQ